MLNSYRPSIAGTRHSIVAGHYLAAHAGFEILESGGNAVDAGCASGIALAVVQSELVNFAGVAPIIFFEAATNKVVTISGLGNWPKRIEPSLFEDYYQGSIPENILRTVVPAAPDAWITALELYGTMTFAEVASSAIRFAKEGFVMYPLMSELIASHESSYRRWDANKNIYLPNDQPPKVGSLFVQKDLADTLQYIADEEQSSNGDRKAGLQAARNAFYRGDIASRIVQFHKENGGYLREDDLAEFRVGIEEPVTIDYLGTKVFTCGPWCQGPALLQVLRLLEHFDLRQMGHNSCRYIHTITEAIKLAFSDRHYYYGDPNFVDVPLKQLLSNNYNRLRQQLIRENEAWPDMPPGGDPTNGSEMCPDTPNSGVASGPANFGLDTSYTCVTDRWGNIFSATPSDVAHNSPVIPGTGLCPSSRGSQGWADSNHPSSVEPGKRPRLTPNPALAIRPGQYMIPFGTPGGDVQVQAMVQCLLNVISWGMDPQQAVESPRFASYSFPDSFEPHNKFPGRLVLESRIPSETTEQLKSLGHEVEAWPDWTPKAGAVCMIQIDQIHNYHLSGADPRRPAYALGW